MSTPGGAWAVQGRSGGFEGIMDFPFAYGDGDSGSAGLPWHLAARAQAGATQKPQNRLLAWGLPTAPATLWPSLHLVSMPIVSMPISAG